MHIHMQLLLQCRVAVYETLSVACIMHFAPFPFSKEPPGVFLSAIIMSISLPSLSPYTL